MEVRKKCWEVGDTKQSQYMLAKAKTQHCFYELSIYSFVNLLKVNV